MFCFALFLMNKQYFSIIIIKITDLWKIDWNPSTEKSLTQEKTRNLPTCDKLLSKSPVPTLLDREISSAGEAVNVWLIKKGPQIESPGIRSGPPVNFPG